MPTAVDIHRLAMIIMGQPDPGGPPSPLVGEVAAAADHEARLDVLRSRLNGGYESTLQAIAQITPSTPRPELPRQYPSTETAHSLLARELPPQQWAVSGVLPVGLGVLGGRPKKGKSWLAVGAATSVATGTRFLGEYAQRGDCLYVALEDSVRRMQDRLRKILGDRTPPTGLHIAYEWPRWDAGGQEAMESWLQSHPGARLVVIDTWGKLQPPARRGGDQYADTYAVVGSVQSLAMRHGVALLVVTHTTKPNPNGGDFLDSIMGSSAVTGAADTVIVLERERCSDAATLRITGRDVDEREIPIAWENGWHVQTPEDFANRSHVGRAIAALLAEVGAWEGTSSALHDILTARRGPAAPRGDGWPLTVDAFGKALAAALPRLEAIGIRVERRHGKDRTIRLSSGGPSCIQ